MTRGLLVIAVLLALSLGSRHAPAPARWADTTEVVVTLTAPPLSHGHGAAAARRVDEAQRAFRAALQCELPSARIAWRYRIVLDGASVVLPDRDVGRLSTLPGVRAVYHSTRYELAAWPGGRQDGVAQFRGRAWTPGLDNTGDGIKIGIVDGGVDQSHPYFNPTGYTMPAGFPKGQTAYTTAKVIVARSFPPPGPTTPAERAPFEPDSSSSEHGTHVAGIAAGNAGTRASGGVTVSGVAPRAYIGNYRAYTVRTASGVGEDGNAPEVVAAIEAAVADGMDVINLSIGEAETEPSRDLIALALDGAAAAGVVPVVAAGNDFAEFGRGSLTSPGSSAKAITVGAVTNPTAGSPGVIADFSSSGPTPLSLRLKPDVAAPGVDILSSVPNGWGTLSGTSMATPQVAGAAALLRQRHPDWSVAQLKAALVETGDDAWASDARTDPALPIRAGGGVVDPQRADQPLLFTEPSSLSFDLLRAGSSASRQVTLTDAGGGAGTWTISFEQFGAADGVAVSGPATVEVPGSLTVSASATADAGERDVSGYVLLSEDDQVRRVPFWLRVTRPMLAGEPAVVLARPGVYTGDTRGRPSLVSTYRYPEIPGRPGLAAVLAGPEQIFRVTLRRPVANFGVVIVSRDRGVTVEPRVVAGADENRLTGYAGLPIILNPYLEDFDEVVPSAGALLPATGTYDAVFDSPTAAGAGRFTFRFWVNDVTPPSAQLAARSVRRGQPLVVRVVDGQSGVDPATLVTRVDRTDRASTYRRGEVRIGTNGLAPGRHRLLLQISDYQETRNMENVAAILPNTRRLVTTIVVRP